MEVLKELYIIRHGQTDHNAQGIVQGKGVNLPLNEMGKQQARKFFEAYRHIRFDRLFASSLLRAQQSIELFQQFNIPMEINEDLDEISWGIMEGQRSTFENDVQFKQMLEKWKQGKIHEKFPGGESPYELQQRQRRFLNYLLTLPEKRVLIATHGRYIRSLMCTLTNVDLSNMESFQHVNFCLYKVNYLSDKKFYIERNCDTVHLQEYIS
jgi:probable phosphoglycerate mutase